jgi:hypothetical protein
MPNIPSTINGVSVTFGGLVKREVHQTLITALEHTIKPDVAAGYTLSEIYVSSASDSHQSPSRHAQSKAVDISRINSKRMSTYYPSDPEVVAIVNALQLRFESAMGRRENFGPHLKHKQGSDQAVSGHADHIHFSVD